MTSETGIIEIIFYVPLLPFGNLMLVEHVDGRIYLIKNDEVLSDRSWTKDEGPQAFAAFHSMKTLATTKKLAIQRAKITLNH
jgi:hypothetical protein